MLLLLLLHWLLFSHGTPLPCIIIHGLTIIFLIHIEAERVAARLLQLLPLFIRNRDQRRGQLFIQLIEQDNGRILPALLIASAITRIQFDNLSH